MILETSRFGLVDVNEERLIEFPEGILGFPAQHQYALMQTSEDSAFFWLQAVDRPDLAFVVCDPRLFVGDYRVPSKSEELGDIGLDDAANAVVFVIVNKVNGMLTGNLQGPLVINITTCQGRQLVLTDRRYGTRHPLMRIPAQRVMEKSA